MPKLSGWCIDGFVKYVDYLNGKDPRLAHAEDANSYLSSLAGKKVSESLIHAAVNSIKFYCEKVEFITEFKLDQVQRPKKSRNNKTCHTAYAKALFCGKSIPVGLPIYLTQAQM